MAPSVEFFEGMRVRSKNRLWTVVQGSGDMVELTSDAGFSPWPRHDLLSAIARGDITIEPTVGMRVECPVGSYFGRIDYVDDDVVVIDRFGTPHGLKCGRREFDHCARSGAWAILPPEPVPSPPPDVDPEATWDGEEDGSADDDGTAKFFTMSRHELLAEALTLSKALAAQVKRVEFARAERDAARYDIDDERFRAKALQEELEKTKAERDAARACRQAADTECRATMEDLGRANARIADLEAKLKEERDRAEACVNGGLSKVALTSIAAEIQRRADHAKTRTDGHADPVRAHVLQGVVHDLAFVAGVRAERLAEGH